MTIIAALGTTQVHNAGNAYQWQSVASDVSAYGTLSVAVYTDQNATLTVAFSKDASTWAHSTAYSITASTAYHVQVPVREQYCRITSATSSLTSTIHHLTCRGLDSVHDLMTASEDSVAAYISAADGTALTQTGGALDVAQQALAHGTDSVTARCQDGSGNALVVSAGELAVADATNAGHLATIAGDTTSLDAKVPALGSAAAAAALPVILATDQPAIPTQVYGSQANAWSAASVSSTDTSTALDCRYAARVTYLGTVDAAITFYPEYSMDNSNWYADSINAIVHSGAGSMISHLQPVAARYVRLAAQSGSGVTVTATLCAKP
jgi:hypothetical protein